MKTIIISSLIIVSSIYSQVDTAKYFGGSYDGYDIKRVQSTNLNGKIIGIRPISTEIPNQFSLSQNYPNPFNPITHFEFRIADFGFVKISVYDILGREVSVLVNEKLKAGIYEAEFDGTNFPSGIYFYKMEAEGFKEIKKMVLVK